MLKSDFKELVAMKIIKIFNMPQARVFHRHGCEVLDFSIGDKGAVGIVFKRDEHLEALLKRWQNKEFTIKDFKERF